jgi:hypothetical protein
MNLVRYASLRRAGEPGGEAAPGPVCGSGRAATWLLRHCPDLVQHPAVPSRAKPRPGRGGGDVRHHRRRPDRGAVLASVRTGQAAPGEPGAVVPWHAQVPYLVRSAVRPPPGNRAGEVELRRDEEGPRLAHRRRPGTGASGSGTGERCLRTVAVAPAVSRRPPRVALLGARHLLRPRLGTRGVPCPDRPAIAPFCDPIRS